MRCQLIRLHWVRIPMREPFRISNGEVAARDAILIEIKTDSGIGWGEAAPMPGLSIPTILRRALGSLYATALCRPFLNIPNLT